MELERLELAVIEKLLDSSLPALVALRRQIPHLSVKSRKNTGVGFFTEFEMTTEAAIATPSTKKIRFGDVEATIPGLQNGAGFLLFVDDGRLHFLEGYSYDEAWPQQITSFELRYSDPGRQKVLKTFG